MLRLIMASPDGMPGDIEGNEKTIGELIVRFRQADVLLFPKLALTGATAGAMLRAPAVLERAKRAALRLAALSGPCLALVGLPLRVGDGVCAAAAALRGGRVEGIVPLPGLDPVPMGTILDGVRVHPHLYFPVGERRLTVVGSEEGLRLACQGFQDLVAFSDARKAEWGERIALPRALQKRLRGGALLYANAGGTESTDRAVYSGLCLYMEGEKARLSESFASGTLLEAREGDGEPLADESALLNQRLRDARLIPALGLARRIQRTKAQGLVLGLSGGIDSAEALLVGLDALRLSGLPEGALHVYYLKGLGSSAKSLSLSRRLCRAAGLPLCPVSLIPDIRRMFRHMGQEEGRHDAAYENAQARARAAFLLNMANRLNCLMIATGDMSESALGFTTYGGDSLGHYAVNRGLTKTALREILRDRAAQTPALRRVLTDILQTPVSPELLPGGAEAQRTEDIVGDYALNDFFLERLVRDKLPLDTIAKQARERFGARDTAGALSRFLERYQNSAFKRAQSPDGPAVMGYDLDGLVLPSDTGARALGKEAP